jgi:hypothetical protein
MGAMSKHRRKLRLVLVVAVTAIVVAVCFRWLDRGGSSHRVNVYTAEKVRLGMTQKEVEGIFAAPPGDYSSEPMVDRAPESTNRRPELRREDWTADEGGAVVYFGPDGRVADAIIWIAPHCSKTSRFERVRKWWYWFTVW